MELDESGYPQPTGRFETLAADTVILALGQESETALPARAAGRRVRARRHRAGVAVADDRLPRRLRRRRHGARASAPSPSASATARRPPATSTPGCATRPRRAAPKHPDRRRFDVLHLWFFGDAARRQQPELALEERVAGFDEVVGGLSAERGDLRGGPVPVVRQLLRVRRLPRRVPGGRRDQARASATATGSTTTAAPAAGRATSSARCTRSRWSRSRADARDDRRQRGRRLGRLPAQRGLLHLPDHAVLADGRAGRRVGEPQAGRTSGAPCPRWSRCRARAGRPARCTARCRAARCRRRSPRRRACC